MYDHSEYGSTLEGKNLLLLEQILSFKNVPILEGLCHPGKQEVTKLFLFARIVKHGDVSNNINRVTS